MTTATIDTNVLGATAAQLSLTTETTVTLYVMNYLDSIQGDR
jgi:hypothetical protein